MERIELSAKTLYSDSKSSIVNIKELIDAAIKNNHQGLAITDYNNTESYLMVEDYIKSYNLQDRLKIIYGATISFDNEQVRVLVKNKIGLKNLYKYLSLYSYDQTKENLTKYREGLLIGGHLTDDDIENQKELLQYYDYVELYPKDYYKNILSDEYIKEIISEDKLFVAVGNVEYINKDEKTIRDALKMKMTENYYRTTEEMLAEFDYLDESKKNEIVITNTHLINDQIEKMSVIRELTVKERRPVLKNADKTLKGLIDTRLKELYQDKIPKKVKERTKEELDGIIINDYASLYLIAHYLIKGAKSHKVITSTRGSLSSSYISYLLEITNINPLDEKNNLYYESFLGVNFEKEPDFDLNFPCHYIGQARLDLAALMGKDKVFTTTPCITPIGLKRAKKLVGQNHSNSDMMVDKIASVKQSTGSHKCKMTIIPSNIDLYDYTHKNNEMYPIYDSVNEFLVKGTFFTIDLLVQDCLYQLTELVKLTSVKLIDISLTDEKVLDLFIKCNTLGLGEYSTPFVRELIDKTNPKTIEDLMRISALSHSNGAWVNNGELLIKDKKLNEIIAYKEDVIDYLLDRDVPKKVIYNILDNLKYNHKKGDNLKILEDYGIDEWFRESLSKIIYLFPKGHVINYTKNLYYLAYFKFYYKKEYYVTLLNDYIFLYKYSEYKNEENIINDMNKTKDKDEIAYYMQLLEMKIEKIKIGDININKSDKNFFTIVDGIVIPPLIKSGYSDYYILDKIGLNRPYKNKEDIKRKLDIGEEDIDEFKKYNLI